MVDDVWSDMLPGVDTSQVSQEPEGAGAASGRQPSAPSGSASPKKRRTRADSAFDAGERDDPVVEMAASDRAIMQQLRGYTAGLDERVTELEQSYKSTLYLHLGELLYILVLVYIAGKHMKQIADLGEKLATLTPPAAS